MDDGILVAIHYVSQIRKDQIGNDVFSCSQPAFVRWPNEEIGLEQLKDFILRSIGQGDTKRVQKVYYRYPHEVEGTFCFKRFSFTRRCGCCANPRMAPTFSCHDESVVGDPTTHPYLFDNDSDNDDVDNEPTVLPPEEEEEDDEEEEEIDVQGVNYFGHTQPAYAQPAISRPYDHPGHFGMLNLGAMDPCSHGFQGGPEDDPVDEFEVGQEFAEKKLL
ncbi:hypothetical protein PIB30_064164 [Stylosanthes scabra]|uniref:Uncharacterized protein n=1 Tax=Stylosanthes scabra TaxID=79078 RepID=A0ABU6WK04_9FABA|nr:hypothetical protein [Stylosanthes scabra]